MIDDSLIVAQLMVYICTKFGIANYDEYSLVYDLDLDDGNSSSKTATLRRVTINTCENVGQDLFMLGSIAATHGQKNGGAQKEVSHR